MQHQASIKNKQYFLTLIVLTSVIVMGVLTSYFIQKIDRLEVNSESSQQLIEQHFNAGVEHMLNKEYAEAVIDWENLLRINDRIPEAHVNLGFSLVEIKKHHQARDHFNIAMDINPYQANAYYGLGLYYDKIGDTEAALGAMRSFIHLAKEGDEPFVRKARSALWEWENPLDQPFIKNQAPSPTEPQSNPDS